MSTFDYQHVIDKMPAGIEAVQDAHLKKLVASVEPIMECAKASGAPQFIEDAKEWARLVEINTEYIKRLLGDEGDQATETGSFYGIITAAKHVKKAVGGDM